MIFLFFFLVAIYFALNQPFQVCFCFSDIWEAFQLTLCKENGKVGVSGEHPGRAVGVTGLGANGQGFIFSLFEAGLC